MAFHTEYPLGCTRISKVLYLFLAVSTLETIRTEGLIPRKNSEIFDLVSTRTAAICTIVANEGSIAEKEKVCIGVE